MVGLGHVLVQPPQQLVLPAQHIVELALREAPWSRSWSIILSSSSCIHRCTPVAVASVEGLIAALCSCPPPSSIASSAPAAHPYCYSLHFVVMTWLPSTAALRGCCCACTG